jgi:hypothetical protein
MGGMGVVRKSLAAAVLSVTLVILIVLPVLFALYHGRNLPRR